MKTRRHFLLPLQCEEIFLVSASTMSANLTSVEG